MSTAPFNRPNSEALGLANWLMRGNRGNYSINYIRIGSTETPAAIRKKAAASPIPHASSLLLAGCFSIFFYYIIFTGNIQRYCGRLRKPAVDLASVRISIGM